VSKISTATSSDSALVEAIARGDQEALRNLNSRYGHALCNVAERILKDKADAEETAADVLWQVWRQAVTYDPSRGSVGAWLMTLVRTRAIDRLRARTSRARTEAAVEDPDPIGDVSITLDVQQHRSLVKAALGKLDRRERTLLELAYYSDLTQATIAEHTGIPLGTVKSRIRAALLKLRKELSGLRGN
jgi:RNA polymerase sigma-70 factor (ECF subfamily)